MPTCSHLLLLISWIAGIASKAVTVREPIPSLYMPACGFLHYKIPENTFHDTEDGGTRNLTLALKNSTGGEIGRLSWIGFDSANQTITAVVSDTLLAQWKIPATFTFRLTATTKRGDSAYYTIRLIMNHNAKNATVSFLFTFVWRDATLPTEPVILKTFLEKFAAYLQVNAMNLRYTYYNTDSIGYFISITNCTQPNSSCNFKGIDLVKSLLFNSLGTLPAFVTAMSPEFYISYIQVSLSGACQKLNRPIVLKPYPPVTVSACSHINHSLPRNVFYDEEDGTNLQLSVHALDGKRVQAETQWVSVNGAENFLYGIITDEIVAKQPVGGYNITIRAYDTSRLFVDAYIKLRINAMPSHKYYRFTLHFTLKPTAFLYNLIEQFYVVQMTNAFFKTNITNLMSYKKLGGKSFTASASICTIGRRCDNDAANAIFSRMVQSGNTPRTDFVNAFAERYILRAVSTHTDPICLQPQNPPVPAINPWTVSATHCGEMKVKIPDYMFTDKEDGNIRNLQIQLLTADNREIPTSEWLQLNSTSKIIHGWPTAIDITANKAYKLVATDRSGLNGTLELRFLFGPQKEAKYQYKLIYRTTKTWPNHVAEASAFIGRMRNYLHDMSLASFGLLKYSEETNNVRKFDYENCSVPYDPCNVEALDNVKALLLSSTQATTGLRNALQPDFALMFGSTTNAEQCTPNQNTPPKVKDGLPVLNITTCGIYEFVIPQMTFHDAEDGYTRNLTLKLEDSRRRPISSDSWLDFDPVKQTITAVATVSIAQSKAIREFTLTATDKRGLYVPYTMKTHIQGPFDVLKECQIEVVFLADQTMKMKKTAYLASYIINRMVSYFGLSSSAEIGVINMIRYNNTVFTFYWSYCSAKYKGNVQSLKLKVDFNGFTNKILKKLFVSGSSTVKQEFKQAFSNLAVHSVKKIFTASCVSIPPVPGLNKEARVYNISNCGYTKIKVTRDWFHDAEDGDAYSLTLTLLDDQRSAITYVESWINYDSGSKQILISVQDALRDAEKTSYKFYLTATDSTGLTAEISIWINLINKQQQKSAFNAHFEFLITGHVVYLNDSILISDRIATAFSLAKGSDVMIKAFREGNGLVRSATFSWSTCAFHACTSNVLQNLKQAMASSSSFDALNQNFLPKFDLKRFSLSYVCGGPIQPPENKIKVIQLNITMCSVLTYTLSSSMFSDVIDIGAKNMRIELLDASMRQVSASSWIQMNTAILQLYAIPGMKPQTYNNPVQFYIQATNSRGLRSHASVRLSVKETPYTSDCPVSMTVTRRFGTRRTVDLKVLHRLLTLISSYYQDGSIKVKVLKFEKLSTYKYSLEYSNCSFTFASKEAAQMGHSESQRAMISAIFARLVKADGSIQTSFASKLSQMFTVTSLKVSYSCIEAPPYPTGATELRPYASTCKEFRDLLSNTLFYDDKDKRNLTYSLAYTNGKKISTNEWLALDEKKLEVFGMITADVKRNAPFSGYRYLLVATDSSGRSANITYIVKISTALPVLDVIFTLGFTTTISEEVNTATVLMNISRSIASYLDGAAKADDILIQSYTAGKSLVFGHCSMQCTQAEYTAKAMKLQKVIFQSEPKPEFITALQTAFTPTSIYINGPKCLPPSSIMIVVTRSITFNHSMCGFINYKIPTNIFTDSIGRKTSDFLLSMYKDTKLVSNTQSLIQFNSGHQRSYGIIAQSKIQSTEKFTILANHSQSASTAFTSLTINFPDYERYQRVASTMCVVTVKMTTKINPAYTDAYIIKRFSERTSAYLGDTSQQIQIVSYTRSASYPIQLTVSFANCSWYSMLTTISNEASASRYTSAVTSTINRLAVNLNTQQTTYNQRYYNFLNEEFTMTSLATNTWCHKPPNMPPKVNITIGVITVKQCTGFFYQIPETAFIDEDGNARHLKLKLYDAKGDDIGKDPNLSWVSFNSASQIIYGKATRHAFLSQAQNGYKFLLTATDRYGLTKTVDLMLKISGSANPLTNEPPKIALSSYEVTIPACGIYRGKLPNSFATDKEDGSLRNLTVSMKMVNGNELPKTSWIQFDSKTQEIYALPPESVTSSNSGIKWNYKIVVNDSCGGMASTVVRISTNTHKTTYNNHVFKIQSFMSQRSSYLEIQEEFLKKVATFFHETSRQYKTISFTKDSLTGYYTFKFGNCTTQRYICPNESQDITKMQQIFSSSVQNGNSFAAFISKSFKVISYRAEIKYQVNAPPTISSSAVTNLQVTSCEGYTQDISTSIFNHREQNSLKITMSLTNGRPIPLNYPIQLIGKTLYVTSFGASSTGLHSVRLTATEPCGQSTYTDMNINIQIPQKPSGYRLIYQGTVQTRYSAVYYVSAFEKALQLHTRNVNYKIHISSYVRSQNTVKFHWSECSKSPCNTTDIIKLRKMLFITGNTIDRSLLAILATTFNNSVMTEQTKDCNLTSPTPPAANGSLEVAVNLCRRLSFQVPVTAFTDKEHGGTRNLHLALLTENRQILPTSHWIQFNRITQTIYGYPRYSPFAAFQRDYKYTLVANDIQSNSASIPVTASIKGNLPRVTYQLTMHGRINSAHPGLDIDCEIILIDKIGAYFNNYDINDISFTRLGDTFSFSWSFCNMRYDKCDCHYIKHLQNLINPIDKFQHAMGAALTITSVSTMSYGVCTHPGGPKRLVDKKEIVVSSGQTFQYFVRNDHFYDHEDGYTQNLTLYIANDKHNQLKQTSWIKVERQHICGIFPLYQTTNQEWSSSIKEYKLIARDACGMESSDSFSVRMNSYRPVLSYMMHVYIYDTMNKIPTSCNKTQTFVYLIASYLNVNRSSVYIYNISWNSSYYNTSSYYSYYNYNTTIVTWSLKNFTDKNCQNETVRTVREMFVYENGTVNPGFKQHMKSEFEVIKVTDDNSSCAIIPVPIPVTKPDGKFPLWILILLLILAILFLLCWLCWVCIPRCCPGCCAGCLKGCCGCCQCCSSLCGKCCMPGGKYASLDDKSLPGTESGVLSDAKAAPTTTGDTLGKEDDGAGGVMPESKMPDSSGYESSIAPTKIDEDEMQLAPDAGQMAYSQPDYNATADETSGGLDDRSDISLVQSTDFSESEAASPNDVESGVAAMPREEPDATSATAPSQLSDVDSGVMAAPLVDEEELMQERAEHRSYSYSDKFDDMFDDSKLSNQQSMQTGTLALPQTPDIFSGDTRRAVVERISTNTNEFQSNPIVENQSFTQINTVESGKRVSISEPTRLILPQEAAVSLNDVNMTESNTNSKTIVTEKRRNSTPLLLEAPGQSEFAYRRGRRSSRLLLLADDDLDGDSEENSGSQQETRRESMQMSQAPQQYSQQSQLQAEPLQLRLVDEDRMSQENRSQGSGNKIRRISIVSQDGTVSELKNIRIVDGNRNAGGRRSSQSRVESMQAASEYKPQQNNSVRRVSISTMNGITSRPSSSEFVQGYNQNNNGFVRSNDRRRLSNGSVVLIKPRSGKMAGYESDSTDSGYGLSRSSKRMRRRGVSGTSLLVDDRYLSDGRYGQDSVGVRRQSVTSVSSSRNRKYSATRNVRRHSAARDVRRNSVSREFEMWSNGDQVHRNLGYESDSYV